MGDGRRHGSDVIVPAVSDALPRASCALGSSQSYQAHNLAALERDTERIR